MYSQHEGPEQNCYLFPVGIIKGMYTQCSSISGIPEVSGNTQYSGLTMIFKTELGKMLGSGLVLGTCWALVHIPDITENLAISLINLLKF